MKLLAQEEDVKEKHLSNTFELRIYNPFIVNLLCDLHVSFSPLKCHPKVLVCIRLGTQANRRTDAYHQMDVVKINWVSIKKWLHMEGLIR